MIKVVLAGSVISSFLTLKKLVQHEFEVIGVFGYEPKNPGLVSGYVNMESYCNTKNIPYFPFQRISNEDIQKALASLNPDLFFVIGLSQLIPEEMLKISRLGNIGFHPTLLPKGRGRAPIAWLILEEKKGAANFFLMGAGTDDGPIFIQEPFDVLQTDNALSIEEKMVSSIEVALDKWLPELSKGLWNPIPQEESLATWYGKRSPEDGWINWQLSAAEIDSLIRASSPPHPGAYSYFKDQKIKILECALEMGIPIKGALGRVLIVKSDKFLIQTGTGLLWVSNVIDEENQPVQLKVGEKLGYFVENEVYKLKKELNQIKNFIKL